jgi:hypothetical protein
MRLSDEEVLKQLALRYIWWKSPEEALRTPQRIVAQVMNLGDHEDVQILVRQLGDAVLRDALTRAEAGQFNARSWTYWHYRLGLAEVDQVPPEPARKFS